MTQTVVGLIENSEKAQFVVQKLVDSGFDRSKISLMTRNEENDSGVTGDAAGSETASATLKGAGTGAAMGGVAGLLVGLAALAIPGIGAVVAAGPIAAALAGAGIGAVAGGGIAALTKMGVSEEDAQYYTEGVRRGGTLVTVIAENEARAEEAVEIMRVNGAVNIDEKAREWEASGWHPSGASSAAASLQEDTAAERQDMLQQGTMQQETMQRQSTAAGESEEQVVPVVKEELQVGKRQVERGGVRVYSHVIETPVEETVQLREQHAEVERRPVDRPLSPTDETAFQEQTIEVRETAEEPVVAKVGRVVEEVVLNKEEIEREETVRDTLRETEVEVEHIGAVGGRSRSAYSGAERRIASAGMRYAGVERRMSM